MNIPFKQGSDSAMDAVQAFAVMDENGPFDADIALTIIKALAEHAVSGWLQDKLYQTPEQRAMMIQSLLCAIACLSGGDITEGQRKARRELNDFFQRWFYPARSDPAQQKDT